MDALRRARSYSSNAHGEMPRRLRARERPHSGDHRHAGCESDRKRGVSIDPIGYDAGKKIKGVKRNALVDTEGHLLSLEVIPGNIQDRDCAAGLIEKALQKYPRLKKIFADGGYAGPKLASQLVGLPVKAGNRQTHRQGGRFQGLASPLGDRTHVLLVAPQSPPDGPLRSPRHDRHWFRQARDDRGVMLKRLTEVAH